MKALGLLALLAAAAPAAPVESPLAAKCQHVPDAAKTQVLALDASISEAASLAALKELRKQTAARPKKYVYSRDAVAPLLARVNGWLIKKQWLDALKNREHDADEAQEYCGFLLSHSGKS